MANHRKIDNTQDHQWNADQRRTKQTQTICLRGALEHTHHQDIGTGANQGAGAAQNRGIAQGNQQLRHRQFVASRPVLNQGDKDRHHRRIADHRAREGHRPHNPRDSPFNRATVAEQAHHPPVQCATLFQRGGHNIKAGDNKQGWIGKAGKGLIGGQHAKH